MGSERKKINFDDVKIAIAVSLLAWPITYFVDTGIKKVDDDKQTVVLASIGFTLLATFIYVVKNISKLKNWMGYVFTVFAFTSMVSLIIGLEFKEWIRGFMSQYLLVGELYLSCPWGCAISLFDGIFLYTMYLMLIHRISNKLSWRSVGIYWGSALFNSMIVLLFGVAAGVHSPTFCILLNVPYALIPLFVVIRLTKEKADDWTTQRIKTNDFLSNIALAIGLTASIWLVFVKGMLSVGSQFTIFEDILSHERALLNAKPAPFAIVQSLVYLFYALPVLCISLFYVLRKEKSQFVWDLSLINGGLLLQGQFSFIVTALDSQTPTELRSDFFNWKFWINNLTLLIVPQIVIWSLYKSNVKSKLK